MLNDKYLGNEILAVCDDWVIVWDGKYNYYLFSCSDARIIKRKQLGRMPYNNASGLKMCEYYTVFDNAAKNLCRVAANNDFIEVTRRCN